MTEASKSLLRNRFHLFCDESATNERYTVIGGVFVHERYSPILTSEIEAIVRRHGGTKELKWNKIRPRVVPMYTEVFDLFFDRLQSHRAHFSALVIDNSRMDHATYNEGDKTLGFSKMLFQLLYKFPREYQRNQPIIEAYLDGRTTKHTPDKLQLMLNRKCARELGLNYDPFRRCQFRNSEEVPCIQMADLISGAIGHAVNRKQIKRDAANHKRQMVEHIEHRLRIPSLAIQPHGLPRGFDIWHFDFSKSGKRSRAPRR